ncbi:sel1 repeat family protein [Polaromonas sp. P1(28)-13]|nr:sel1 repeat family protein [Polaromonas sp. P1(28)-13]
MVTLSRSLDPVYAANKPVVTALPVYPDPYPTPRYTNFDPTSYEVASQTAYQRGRVAYQAKQFTNAYPLLNEAAMLGDERAMTLLGGMAQNGQGGQVIDLGRARLYYESAAAKGFGPAIGTLGLMSLTGKGTSKNAAEAARLFVLADSRNYLRATAMLGMMHLDGNVFGKNAEMGRQFAERAASGGDALGRALFGTLLRDGIGGPNDPVKGFSLISQAAPNLSWASYQLGISYEKGAGTAVDKEKAIAAYRSAANGGIAAAESRLQMLTSK